MRSFNVLIESLKRHLYEINLLSLSYKSCCSILLLHPQLPFLQLSWVANAAWFAIYPVNRQYNASTYSYRIPLDIPSRQKPTNRSIICFPVLKAAWSSPQKALSNELRGGSAIVISRGFSCALLHRRFVLISVHCTLTDAGCSCLLLYGTLQKSFPPRPSQFSVIILGLPIIGSLVGL